MSGSTAPLIVTSISPSMRRGTATSEADGAAYQRACIQSWRAAGAQVVSVNNTAEIELLERGFPDVEFVISAARRSGANPKGLPSIAELLEVGCSRPTGSVFAVTNSDVAFRGDSDVLQSIFKAGQGGCAYANRHEWAPVSSEPGLSYLYGYDLFVVENTFVSPIEMADFYIGAPWWDYLFLYLLAARQAALTVVGSPVISHSTHDQQWSFESWRRGLALVAKRIRQLSEEEGPAAALLGYICRSFEDGAISGFAMDRITSELGTVFGTAMVAHITDSSQQVLWFQSDEYGDTLSPHGHGTIAYHQGPFELTS